MSSKRKVALAVGSFDGGGAERVITTLANDFIKKDYDVDLLVLFNKGPYKSILDENVNVIELTNSSDGPVLRKCRAFFRIAKYIKSNERTIMVTLRYLNVFFAMVNLLCRGKGKIFVREADTLDEIYESKTLKSRILLHLIKFLYPKQFGIIANCQITKKDLISNIGDISEKISVIYNPLDLKRIKKSIDGIEKEKEFTIVVCGRLVEKKNFKDAISALKEIKLVHKDAKLIILGEGPELNSLKKYAENLSISDSVVFKGFVDDPYKYYASSHVFVQTSRYEGFGYVLAEALACGVSVVAYDGRGAMREILDNGKYGELVPLGNVKELTEAILRTVGKNVDTQLTNDAVLRFDSDYISESYLKLLVS